MDWGLAWATTATGMIVVFAVLVILIIIVAILGKIMYAATGKNKEAAKENTSRLQNLWNRQPLLLYRIPQKKASA